MHPRDQRLPTNNIQWLRLGFALQVLVTHAFGHFGKTLPHVVGNFPGVPAFFFVSGFLIYAAYLRSSPATYARNRFLRLFPGLAAVTIGTLAFVLSVRGVDDLALNPSIYLTWLVSQVTIAQPYNPAIFSDVGIGEMNGALWTITVEIIFYACVPILARIERRLPHAVIIFTAVSFALYAFRPVLEGVSLGGTRSLYGAMALTPIIWGWMFGAGILAYKYFDNVRPWLRYAPWALVPLIALAMIDNVADPFVGSRGNSLGLAYFLCYAALILWVAFDLPRIPLEADFSYGIYIWHMPVFNAFIEHGHMRPELAVPAACIAGALSWYLIENPANILRVTRGERVRLLTRRKMGHHAATF
ncbi:acyltransferase family protein [Sphingopyxis macrogoltabida]|uniref:Acyltransferase 3 domain-containing protein n=1 Tax=Sphingopyxis macrogoltabida TaxID=33050 RepID=A0A0N9V2A6_SPHMC|nr:acyltransferase [Sphingopyxis macrogoltabida]ALH82900.1 hypothetical protein AN936_21840 [Sphingopyxis macrogoltabida]